MNAVLLTVLATLSGTNGAGYTASDAAISHGGVSYAEAGAGCDSCEGAGGCRDGHCGKGHKPHGGWLGMMPQTCYNPTFGCYDGNRHNNRYPAFHGTYYRRPYNYRNLFDYPWHADLHEPTSQFAYNVNEQPAVNSIPSGPAPVPTPVPDTMGRNVREPASPATRIRSASFPKLRNFGH